MAEDPDPVEDTADTTRAPSSLRTSRVGRRRGNELGAPLTLGAQLPLSCLGEEARRSGTTLPAGGMKSNHDNMKGGEHVGKKQIETASCRQEDTITASHDNRPRTPTMHIGPGTDNVVIGREANLHPNKRYKSSTINVKKTHQLTATTRTQTTSAALGDEDSGYGSAHQPPPSDVDGGAYQPQIPNATNFSSQMVGDIVRGVVSEANHGNDLDSQESHDEADEDANNSFVRHTAQQTNRNNHERQDHHAATTFPQHLMDIIEIESQRHEKPRILEWVEGGDAFLIGDKEAFEQILLPKYFNHMGGTASKNTCKFMSFVRKLYRWGFRQVEKSSLASTSMTFMNPNFIRGDKQRCLLMRSIVKKSVSATRTSMPRQSSPQQGASPPMSMIGAQFQIDQQEGPRVGGGVVSMIPATTAAVQPRTSTHILIPAQPPFGLSALLPHPGLIPEEQRQHQIHLLLPLSSYNHPALQNLAYQGVILPLSQRISTNTSTAIPSNFMARTSTTSGPARISTTSSGHHLQSETVECRLLQQVRRQELVQQICNNYPVVALASQVMRNNPGMDPLRALQLAKQWLPGHDSNP